MFIATLLLLTLPINCIAAEVSIFKPSLLYIVVQTSLGIRLEIQLSPLMQVFISATTAHKGSTCGMLNIPLYTLTLRTFPSNFKLIDIEKENYIQPLSRVMTPCLKTLSTGLCGNFNNIMSDDFRVTTGLVEGTAVAFANTWKTMASCPDIKARLVHPCNLGVENGTVTLKLLINIERSFYNKSKNVYWNLYKMSMFVNNACLLDSEIWRFLVRKADRCKRRIRRLPL